MRLVADNNADEEESALQIDSPELQGESNYRSWSVYVIMLMAACALLVAWFMELRSWDRIDNGAKI